MECCNFSRDFRSEHQRATGSLCCSECFRVIYKDEFQDETTFVTGAGGESQVSGNYVRSIQSNYSTTLENGKMQINDLMVSDLSLGDKANKFHKDVVSGENANQDIKNSGRSSTLESITAHATEKLLELCEENVKGDENAPADSDESDYLSDIDDMEVYGYFNSKDDKPKFWEEMFKERPQTNLLFPPRDRSSKINYNVLEKLFDSTI